MILTLDRRKQMQKHLSRHFFKQLTLAGNGYLANRISLMTFEWTINLKLNPY